MKKKGKEEYLKPMLDTMKTGVLLFKVMLDFVLWVQKNHPLVWKEFSEKYGK